MLVAGVSMDEDPSIVAPFLKKHPMGYPVGLGTPALTQQYSLDELPVTVVFDKTGKLVKRFTGGLSSGDELKAAVEKGFARKPVA